MRCVCCSELGVIDGAFRRRGAPRRRDAARCAEPRRAGAACGSAISPNSAGARPISSRTAPTCRARLLARVRAGAGDQLRHRCGRPRFRHAQPTASPPRSTVTARSSKRRPAAGRGRRRLVDAARRSPARRARAASPAASPGARPSAPTARPAAILGRIAEPNSVTAFLHPVIPPDRLSAARRRDDQPRRGHRRARRPARAGPGRPTPTLLGDAVAGAASDIARAVRAGDELDGLADPHGRRSTALDARRRFALIGDAAHAMTPFAAQGAAMAIEDAVTLADVVAGCAAETGARRSRPGKPARRPRIAKVVRRGALNRFAWHASGPVALARNLFLKTRSPEKLAADLDWLYGWRQQPTAGPISCRAPASRPASAAAGSTSRSAGPASRSAAAVQVLQPTAR